MQPVIGVVLLLVLLHHLGHRGLDMRESALLLPSTDPSRDWLWNVGTVCVAVSLAGFLAVFVAAWHRL